MREVGCELVEEMQITKTATTEAVRNANSPTASARSTNGWHTDSRFGFLPTTSERWDLEWNSSVFVSEIVPSHPGLRLDAFPDPLPRWSPSPPDWMVQSGVPHASSIGCSSSPGALWLCDWRHVASADDLDGGSRDGGVA
jgi:hypothetical protein